MPYEISATALLQSDFDRIDEEVDRIAMAYCEARLAALAYERDNRDNPDRNKRYDEEWHKLRDALIHTEDGSLAHLLYWLDIRANHWSHHPAPPEDAAGVAQLLEHFANDARRLQSLARRARDHQQAEAKNAARTGRATLYRNADALHSLTHS